MHSTLTFRPASHVAVAEFDGETVLLNVSSGIYFGLNPIASRIWQLLGTGASEPLIVQTLLDEYDVDEARLRADVAATVRQLAADGLVCQVEA
ncbi:MAG: PqqD family protein [Chloroflexi bacterium]|nr:PqqD family protein [Chloroflexota bacterium]